MKYSRVLLFILLIILILSCSGLQPSKQDEPNAFLSLNATVQECTGKDLTASLIVPEIKSLPDTPIGEIARQVVKKSLVLEGMQTEIKGRPAIVREVRGNVMKIETEKINLCRVGEIVQLSIPKKTIAVVDFEVIKGTERETGKVALEGLTSALIDSGQFIVLERTKLKSVLSEIELSKSGMAADKFKNKAGDLLIADLVLTGTLSELSGEWDVNLRMINVRTGQALSAVNMTRALFKSSELRDAGPWDEDFEKATADPSWILAYKHRKTGEYARIGIDRKSGADGSKKSLRIDFKFVEDENKPFFASASNNKKRNLALFSGIEFYIRGSEKLYAQANIITSSPDDPNKMDKWMGGVEIDEKWERVRIPFDQMILARRWIKQGAAMSGARPGDQIMRMHRVEGFEIGVDSTRNPATQGTLWVDRIRFYRD
jgi:TolB-like protein